MDPLERAAPEYELVIRPPSEIVTVHGPGAPRIGADIRPRERTHARRRVGRRGADVENRHRPQRRQRHASRKRPSSHRPHHRPPRSPRRLIAARARRPGRPVVTRGSETGRDAARPPGRRLFRFPSPDRTRIPALLSLRARGQPPPRSARSCTPATPLGTFDGDPPRNILTEPGAAHSESPAQGAKIREGPGTSPHTTVVGTSEPLVPTRRTPKLAARLRAPIRRSASPRRTG